MARYHVRRTDRELSEPEDLTSILRRGRFATIAMCQDGEPYLVTLSYGYDPDANRLYFHVAPAGRKLEALAADSRVCATVVIDGGYEQGACKHRYESVVFTGRMMLVDDLAEAREGMRVLLAHLENEPGTLWEKNRLGDDATFDRLRIAKLDIEAITGKAGS
jgi:nitroimidazol reductase NimA-like FMN-containing flavoprotein (pyridoxamine 5'-phosphate oxidase superfamily)